MIRPDELARLTEIAQDAYQRAREQVFDHYPPGAKIDYDSLTPRQWVALEKLALVEAELADYRREAYAPERVMVG
jgi:hypothetical protein